MSEETYKKQRPVPFGEYVPMAWLFEAVLPSLTEISMLERNTTAGESSALLKTGNETLGGLICFDSIYPALARKSAKDGAEIFLLSTDDSWFDGSFGKSLHFRHATLRAAENGRTVVRTGNTGLSGVIDAKGRVLETVPLDTEGYAIADVTLTSHKTLYTHMGDVVPYLSLASLVLIPLIHYYVEQRRTKKG
jgi:apolipoprotein N-acyltransferase